MAKKKRRKGFEKNSELNQNEKHINENKIRKLRFMKVFLCFKPTKQSLKKRFLLFSFVDAHFYFILHTKTGFREALCSRCGAFDCWLDLERANNRENSKREKFMLTSF